MYIAGVYGMRDLVWW